MPDPAPAPETRPGRLGPVLLDLLLLLAVGGLAAWFRLAQLDAAPILSDQASHVRAAHEILFDQPVLLKPYYYTSAYYLLLVGFIAVLGEPARVLVGWALAGALAAPLVALAVRRLAGPLAALAAGVVVALHPGDAAVVMGLKSPYFITTFVGLGLLGLAGGVQRRPWGPPLMAFGMAMVVAMHLGVWPLGVLGCAMALSLAATTTPRRGWRVLATLAAPAVPTAWLAAWDAERLVREARNMSRFGAPMFAQARDNLQQRVLDGLGLDLALLRVVAGGLAGGLVLAAVFWLFRRSEAGRRWTSQAQARAVGAGVLATLLLAVGPLHLARLARSTGYLEEHHLLALHPLMVVAAAGLACALLPARPRWLPALAPTLILGAWAGWRVQHTPGPAEPMRIAGQQVLPDLLALSAPIRADGEARGRWPATWTWLPDDGQHRHQTITDLLGDLGRWGRDPRGQPTTCWLVAAPSDLPGPATIEIHGLAAFHDPDCTVLPAMEDRLCDTGDRLRLRRRRPEPEGPDAWNAHLPCASWEQD